MRGGVQEKIGCIEILDNVFIGSGSIILGNVRIGPNAVIAAGSLIIKDVPPNSIVGGVPAKVIGDFKSLLEKRKDEIYPNELKPNNQEIKDELIKFMWERFWKERDE